MSYKGLKSSVSPFDITTAFTNYGVKGKKMRMCSSTIAVLISSSYGEILCESRPPRFYTQIRASRRETEQVQNGQYSSGRANNFQNTRNKSKDLNRYRMKILFANCRIFFILYHRAFSKCSGYLAYIGQSEDGARTVPCAKNHSTLVSLVGVQ